MRLGFQTPPLWSAILKILRCATKQCYSPMTLLTDIRAPEMKKASSFLTRLLIVVGEEGFEPPTLWSQTRCATKLRYSPTSFVSILGIVNQHWKPKLPIICKERMGWLTRFELATTGITIQGSTN